MKELTKKLIVCFSALILAAIMIIIYFTVILPKPIKGNKTITLNIIYADKNYKYENLNTDKEFLLDFLQQYNKNLDLNLIIEEGPYGAFLTSLKNTPQDSQKGYYYTYTINEQDVFLGISAQPIKDGDIITFKYSLDKYEEITKEDGSKDYILVSSTLVNGGKDSLNTVLIGFIIIISVLVIFALGYLVAYFIKNKRNNLTK